MTARPPIVVILGHVDHGKTTLLDYIRKSNITDKEFGGITQKIGGYEIQTAIKGYKTNKLTFIDTPGHEAFSFLRARGANVADIAILIIDAKDSLMPQTIESISHIKDAKIPFIVALNKIDLEDANPEKVKRDLMKCDIITEDKGGKTVIIPISAKKGTGVTELLETILLITSDLNLTYNPSDPVEAYIIETRKDKSGIVASAIIKNGSLKIGDVIYVNNQKTKIRSLINDRGIAIHEVSPSTPFELLGFDEIPPVGGFISNKPIEKKESKDEKIEIKQPKFDIDSFLEVKKIEKKLSIIIKADSQGSLEAIYNSLKANSRVDIILKGVGNVHKSDIFLAKTSGSIIIGFNIKIDPETKDLSKQEKVIIKTYNIIYELLDELTEVADLMKEKEEKEKNLKGEAKILASFNIENEKVYGVKITKGKFNLADEIQFFRNSKLIGKSKIVSLQIRAKKAEEVKKDQEAGMLFSPALDIKVGDVVKSIL